jgi:hypothetical protein
MLLTDFRDAPAPCARYNGTRSYEVASNLGRINFRTNYIMYALGLEQAWSIGQVEI